MLLNLVGNAIKFTDQGEVAINVAAANDSLSIAVRDTGPGIAPEDQARLFENFNKPTTRSPNTKAVPGWDGQFPSASSKCTAATSLVDSSIGHGAVFTIALPLKVEQQINLS